LTCQTNLPIEEAAQATQSISIDRLSTLFEREPADRGLHKENRPAIDFYGSAPLASAELAGAVTVRHRKRLARPLSEGTGAPGKCPLRKSK
jgi:hypothetical protein